MRSTEWWKHAVVYQIYPRSFKDSNGDGIGDIGGRLSRLDYLNDGTDSSLGIDAIWLNPVYPSPQYDFGYDIMDHRNIDPQYGSLEDFDRLLAEAHRRGIRIIMDFVPSVTSHLHPWFIESRSSAASPKRDWYLWRRTSGRTEYPNNWYGFFGGRAWEWDNKTGEFYYHNSLPEQPDLNWRNPEVARAMLDNMRFWYDRGVDGFRIDVLNYVYKDREFRSNPPCLGRRPYEMQRHIYEKDLTESYEVAGMMRAVADEYGEKMLVGEIYNPDIEYAAGFLGENKDGVNMVFNFSFAEAPFNPRRFRKEIENSERVIAKRGWPSYFLSNHDITRHISRFGGGARSMERARVAAAMLLTLRGTPFLYMGEEIGMAQTPLSRRDILDPPGQRYWPFYKGRDGARTPMQWSAAPYAGFSTARPWLPVHPDYPKVNVEKASGDSSSLLRFYRRLIWFRKEQSALLDGSIRFLDAGGKTLAFLRESERQLLLVCMDFSGGGTRFSPRGLEGASGRLVFSSHDISNPEISCDSIKLPPYGVMIAEI